MTKDFEDIAIKAANEYGLTKQQLMDFFWDNGLMGVYNLGMKHMYEYLKEHDNGKLGKQIC